MRRILTVLALALIMTAVVVAMVMPAFAKANHFNQGTNITTNPGGSNQETHCNSHVGSKEFGQTCFGN